MSCTHMYTHVHLSPHILLVALEVKVKLAGEGRTTSDGGNDGEDEVDYAAADGGSDDEVQDNEEMERLWTETRL